MITLKGHHVPQTAKTNAKTRKRLSRPVDDFALLHL
jgi:hypothetical protein